MTWGTMSAGPYPAAATRMDSSTAAAKCCRSVIRRSGMRPSGMRRSDMPRAAADYGLSIVHSLPELKHLQEII